MGLINGVFRSLTAADVLQDSQTNGESLRNRFSMARRYVSTYYGSRKANGVFRSVRTYCLFVGHARSGSTLVGALLDAHPNVILADEVDVLKYIAAGFTREQIFHLLLERSQFQAHRGRTKPGRDAQNYSYQVPGQWQGRFDQLQVIGDRKAGKSTQRLTQDPALLSALQSRLGSVQLKVINTIRNPFDTISTMFLRSARPIASGIEQYFSNCATLRRLQEQLPPASLFLLKHEAFLHNPTDMLYQLCHFLSLTPEPGYIQSCASILYANPSKSRLKVTWSQEQVQAVEARIGEYEFLQGYSFEA